MNQFVGSPLGDSGLIALGYRVPAFFALSGFVQYLSSAKMESIGLNVPYSLFSRRRTLRLMPAYYASLFFCLALAFFLQATHLTGPRITQDYLTAFGIHLLLLQSWASPHFQAQINTPIWMMGYETLFSLGLPLLLLFARRLTWAALVVMIALLTLIPGAGPTRLLLPPGLLMAFVFGMMAARAARRLPADTAILGPLSARLISLLLALAGFTAFFFFQSLTPGRHWQMESVMGWLAQFSAGAAMAALCVGLTYAPRGFFARAFSFAPLVALGRLSYSLFLLHYPLLMYCSWAAQKLPKSIPIWVPFALLAPCIVGLAYVFYRLFEAPFQKANRKD